MKNLKSTIFLANVLVLGTIATISPSFMLGAQAEPYYRMDDRYNSYEPEPGYPPQYPQKEYNNYEQPEYEMDSYEKPSYRNDYYEQPREYPSYQQEYSSDNSYYKSKDSSKSVSINKIKCNNINVNVNGLELSVLPPFLGSGLEAEAQDANTDANSFANNNGGSNSGSTIMTLDPSV